MPSLSGEVAGEDARVTIHRPIAPSGEIFGYYVLAKQYFEHYRLPIMHTETNRKDAAEAPAWLWKEWSNILRLRHDGVPILGFTWYSLIDQTDWDTALTRKTIASIPWASSINTAASVPSAKRTSNSSPNGRICSPVII